MAEKDKILSKFDSMALSLLSLGVGAFFIYSSRLFPSYTMFSIVFGVFAILYSLSFLPALSDLSIFRLLVACLFTFSALSLFLTGQQEGKPWGWQLTTKVEIEFCDKTKNINYLFYKYKVDGVEYEDKTSCIKPTYFEKRKPEVFFNPKKPLQSQLVRPRNLYSYFMIAGSIGLIIGIWWMTKALLSLIRDIYGYIVG